MIGPDLLYWIAEKVTPQRPYGPLAHLDREDVVQEVVLALLQRLAGGGVDLDRNPGSYLWKCATHTVKNLAETAGRKRRYRADTTHSPSEILTEDRRLASLESWPTGAEVRAGRLEFARRATEAGWTQTAVADKLGLTPSAVCRMLAKG